MRRTLVVAVLVFVGALPFRLLSAAQAVQFDLPPELTKYRDWPKLIVTPQLVPFELSVLCMPPRPADRAAARQKSGPHAERYIRVYGNKLALDAVSGTERRPFPTGAILVKEKLLTPDAMAPEGLGVMIKRGTPAFAGSGGWEFSYFPAGDSRGTQEACAACHRGAAAKDYVFGTYPK